MEQQLFNIAPADSFFNSPSQTAVIALTESRLKKAKIAYTTHAVPHSSYRTLVTGNIAPRSGDLVLARIDKIGSHKAVETADGRRRQLFPGDEIIVCYGPRYAPDQFEAVLPSDLSACHLVAAGGLAGKVVSSHDKTKSPTTITPLGIVGDVDGRPLNLADWKVRASGDRRALPPTFVFVGTSMNSGKTTSAAYFIQGLSRAGLRVGAAKVTGAGSPRDVCLFQDAGAATVVDFTDAGFSSTAGISLQELVTVFHTLQQHLTDTGCEVLVLEVADGLYQQETGELLGAKEFRQAVDGVIFAAGDAMGATAGVEWLRRHGLPVLGLTGLVTASPLASREAEVRVNLPLLTLKHLSDPEILQKMGINELVAKRLAGKDEAA